MFTLPDNWTRRGIDHPAGPGAGSGGAAGSSTGPRPQGRRCASRRRAGRRRRASSPASGSGRAHRAAGERHQQSSATATTPARRSRGPCRSTPCGRSRQLVALSPCPSRGSTRRTTPRRSRATARCGSRPDGRSWRTRRHSTRPSAAWALDLRRVRQSQGRRSSRSGAWRWARRIRRRRHARPRLSRCSRTRCCTPSGFPRRPAQGGCGGARRRRRVPEPDRAAGLRGDRHRFLSGGGVGSPPYRMIADTDETRIRPDELLRHVGNGDPDSWISAINWNKLLGSGAPSALPPLRPPGRPPGGGPRPARPRPREPAAAVAVDSVRGCPRRRRLRPPRTTSSWRATPRGAASASVPMTATEVAREGAPGSSMLDGDVPAAGVASVQVELRRLRGGWPHRRRPPAAAAAFTAPTARRPHGRRSQRRRELARSDPDGIPVTAELAYSADGGRTFGIVYGGAAGRSVRFPSRCWRRRSRGGCGCASATASTRPRCSRPVRGGARRPAVTILSPVARQRVAAGSSLYLSGGAVDAAGRAIPAADCAGSRTARRLAGERQSARSCPRTRTHPTRGHRPLRSYRDGDDGRQAARHDAVLPHPEGAEVALTSRAVVHVAGVGQPAGPPADRIDARRRGPKRAGHPSQGPPGPRGLVTEAAPHGGRARDRAARAHRSALVTHQPVSRREAEPRVGASGARSPLRKEAPNDQRVAGKPALPRRNRRGRR